MDQVLSFAADNPITAVILALIIASVLTSPFRYGFRAYNRRLRSLNIRERGWPPEHLDADGDFKPEPEED
jgi:hypothetical protein